MPIVDIDPETGRRVEAGWTPSRDARMPRAARAGMKWNKAREPKFDNDLIHFKHLDEPLTKKQKGRISKLANDAFVFLGIRGWSKKEWRQDQTRQICHGHAMSDVDEQGVGIIKQEDYVKLRSHFLALCGDVEGSVRDAMSSTRGAQDRAGVMHLIEAVLCKLPPRPGIDTDTALEGKARRSAWGWAQAISRARHGDTMDKLDLVALRALHLFLVRAVAKKRKDMGPSGKPAKAAKKTGARRKKTEAKASNPPSVALGPCTCGARNITVSLGVLRCPACGRSMEGRDLASTIVRWNRKGGAGV